MGASPSTLPHGSQGPLPAVTSWSLSQGRLGRGWSEATGSRCPALQHPHCSWRPAAPAGRGPWPVRVLASRQSDRQNAVCNMSGRPEPGNGQRKQRGNISEQSPGNTAPHRSSGAHAFASRLPHQPRGSYLLLHHSTL